MPTRLGQTIEKKNTENRKERDQKERRPYEELRRYFGLKEKASKLEVL
jgi:hypothetical protein